MKILKINIYILLFLCLTNVMLAEEEVVSKFKNHSANNLIDKSGSVSGFTIPYTTLDNTYSINFSGSGENDYQIIYKNKLINDKSISLYEAGNLNHIKYGKFNDLMKHKEEVAIEYKYIAKPYEFIKDFEGAIPTIDLVNEVDVVIFGLTYEVRKIIKSSVYNTNHVILINKINSQVITIEFDIDENNQVYSLSLVIRTKLKKSSQDATVLNQPPSNDTILSTSDLGETLDGGGGNDNITGGKGIDTIIGGEGTDTLNGANGNDIYTFNIGDGIDTINDTGTIENSGADKIVFGLGITQGNSSINIVGSDLVINYGTSDVLTILNNNIEIIEFSDDGSEVLNYSDAGWTIIGTEFVDVLVGTVGDDKIIGLEDDDDISGGDGDDVISGKEGIDELNGEDGRDYIIGGLGDDILDGGTIGLYNPNAVESGDIYYFENGDGDDIINESSNIWHDSGDTIKFGSGIVETDLTYQQVGNQLVLTYNSGADSITINNQYLLNNAGYTIEFISFDDGSSLDNSGMLDKLTTNGDDNLIGSGWGETIDGKAGNDTLTMGDGRDYIIGGLGDDILDGGGIDIYNPNALESGDIYYFENGDGNDIINDNSNEWHDSGDTIKFGSGIVETDLTYQQVGNQLVLTYNSGADSITINNQYILNNVGYTIEFISFDNGSSLDNNGMLDKLTTNGNDVIIGSEWDETLNGKKGNDDLKGGNGKDTYYFELGDGIDIIEDNGNSSIDRIKFGPGITDVNNLTITTLGDDVIIDYGTTDKITITNGKLAVYKIEKLEFNSGSVIDLVY
jgi:Ca2+-binding RTX toxin-like protein